MNSTGTGSSWLDSHGHIEYKKDENGNFIYVDEEGNRVTDEQYQEAINKGEAIATDPIKIEGSREGGEINLSGTGKIIVNGGAAKITENFQGINVWDAKDINIKDGGTLEITSGSNLVTVITPEIMEKSTINLTDTGTINLSGGLLANVEGDGNLNVKSSSALVDGNVSGSNLTFEADHSLSKAVSGTIGELASLNVNKGTLNFDKQTGLINEVNVAENAGLQVNIPGSGPAQENIQLAVNSFTSSGNIVLDSNSDITARNNIEINGGSIVATNGDLESFNTININKGTLHLSDDSDITAFNGLNVNDGEINIAHGEIWSLGDVNLTGGTINMSDFASITTAYDDLDGIFSNSPKPEDAGDINITGSTVNVKNNALMVSEGDISLNNKGIINIDNGATLFATKILADDVNESDVAEVIQNNKATINLTGTGAINIAGNLAANVEGNGNLNIKSSNAVINGDITGSQLTFEADHSLKKALLGENIKLASLNVNKGTLTFDKQPTSITNLNVAGGLDIGTNTVKATNVSFKDNSTLKFTVAGKEDGSYGKIKASTIDISTTGTKLDLTLNSSVLGQDESKDFTILDGSVSGDFAELSKNSRYEFEKLGNGQYKITGKASAADIATEAGGSANNVGTATAWDGVSLDNPSGSTSGQVANALAELAGKPDAASQKAYVDALTAVAPEVAPMVQHTQTETANQVFGAIGTRLSGGSISTGGEGMSSGDNVFERAAMWVQGLFNKSKLEDTSKSYGFDADSNGIAMGAEKYVTEDTKVGLGYAYTNTDIDGFKRDTDVDTHTAFVYGEYKPSNWYVNGIMSYGWSDYSENKNVSGVGVKADYDAETFGLQAMTGYDMQLKHFGLTPEVGLRYVHISQDGYTDSADQKVSGNDSDILTGVIGAKVSKNFELSNGMNIKPEARIAATYDLMNDDVNSVVTLANGSAYMVEGDALDRFGMEFGAGVTAEVNDNVEFALGYEGKFREDYQDHTGLVNLKYKF